MSSNLAAVARRSTAAALVLLLLGVVPAFAVDGVVEIDQACALSGCFVGDLPGFPVQITQDGSYQLTGNLDVSDGGLTVITVASFATVDVDLNGFVVRGAYACSATPPNCPALAGHGVRLGAGGRMTLHGGTIDNIGGTGVLLETSSTATIERVTVSQTGGRGIDALGHVTVRESAVHSTQADGIHALSAKVFDTRVSSTRGDAIDISDRGLVWGVETTNNFAASLRLIGNLAGYSLCRLDRTPVGGKNLGQNLCGDVGTGVCP